MPAAPTREFLDADVLARLMNLPLVARGPMEGSVSGRHQSPHRGSSVEFAEYRKYVAGDDTRHLDWRVYARSDRFYMKEFEADTNLRCYLVVDTSASMGFSAEHGSKFAYARRLAATLGYLVMHQGDAVGLSLCADKMMKDIPPRRNPAHLKNVFDALAEAVPAGKTGLVAELHRLAEKIRRRALVLIFSDLFTEPAELLDCFRHLRFRKHDLAVFHLLDRQEVSFPFERPTRFVDMESTTGIVVEPGIIAPRYHETLAQYLETVRGGCREFGVDYRLVTTDQSVEKVIGDFLLARL